MALRSQIIRLAYVEPHLRKDLLPLVVTKQAAFYNDLESYTSSVGYFLGNLREVVEDYSDEGTFPKSLISDVDKLLDKGDLDGVMDLLEKEEVDKKTDWTKEAGRSIADEIKILKDRKEKAQKFLEDARKKIPEIDKKIEDFHAFSKKALANLEKIQKEYSVQMGLYNIISAKSHFDLKDIHHVGSKTLDELVDRGFISKKESDAITAYQKADNDWRNFSGDKNALEEGVYAVGQRVSKTEFGEKARDLIDQSRGEYYGERRYPPWAIKEIRRGIETKTEQIKNWSDDYHSAFGLDLTGVSQVLGWEHADTYVGFDHSERYYKELMSKASPRRLQKNGRPSPKEAVKSSETQKSKSQPDSKSQGETNKKEESSSGSKGIPPAQKNKLRKEKITDPETGREIQVNTMESKPDKTPAQQEKLDSFWDRALKFFHLKKASSPKTLRNQLIRIAYQNPDLRKDLLPLLESDSDVDNPSSRD